MSFSGISDIDQKICEYLHLRDIMNVIFTHPKIKVLIVNNFNIYLKGLRDEYLLCKDDDCEEHEYEYIENFIIKLLEVDEIDLVRQILDLDFEHDYYNIVYTLLSEETPSYLTSKAIINLFIILPENYENELISIPVYANTVLNVLEPAYNKGLYLLVDKCFDYYKNYYRGGLISNLKLDEYQQRELKILTTKIKALVAIDDLMMLNLQYDFTNTIQQLKLKLL